MTCALRRFSFTCRALHIFINIFVKLDNSLYLFVKLPDIQRLFERKSALTELSMCHFKSVICRACQFQAYELFCSCHFLNTLYYLFTVRCSLFYFLSP